MEDEVDLDEMKRKSLPWLESKFVREVKGGLPWVVEMEGTGNGQEQHEQHERQQQQLKEEAEDHLLPALAELAIEREGGQQKKEGGGKGATNTVSPGESGGEGNPRVRKSTWVLL